MLCSWVAHRAERADLSPYLPIESAPCGSLTDSECTVAKVQQPCSRAAHRAEREHLDPDLLLGRERCVRRQRDAPGPAGGRRARRAVRHGARWRARRAGGCGVCRHQRGPAQPRRARRAGRGARWRQPHERRTGVPGRPTLHSLQPRDAPSLMRAVHDPQHANSCCNGLAERASPSAGRPGRARAGRRSSAAGFHPIFIMSVCSHLVHSFILPAVICPRSRRCCPAACTGGGTEHAGPAL